MHSIVGSVAAVLLVAAVLPSEIPRNPREFDIERPATATGLLSGTPGATAVFSDGLLRIGYAVEPGIPPQVARERFLDNSMALFSRVFVSSLVRFACVSARAPALAVDGYDDGSPAMEICLSRENHGQRQWTSVATAHLPLFADRASFRRDLSPG